MAIEDESSEPTVVPADVLAVLEAGRHSGHICSNEHTRWSYLNA